ncbi:hypothetical protein OESDEN_21803 [Oesophagostomum dentatum]|uniref:Uncharacterized protein n=1 Tax=Oesophagostomum dentatum TaxID=61180 RepID=A0A0B1S0X1_OESDE|nr:hypothetical protein OESDEN_21803 [Oesophagostomum dentatum]
MEHVLQCHARQGAEMRNLVSSLRSSTTEILARVPPASEAPSVLTYPYGITKEEVDDIQLRSKSATVFARNVESKIFETEKDKNENLENRAAQDKVCSFFPTIFLPL